jgi:predicted metal-dependent hydrolase
LLHLIVPTHTKAYRLQLSQHIPDWQQREQELGGWVFATSQHQT